MQAFNKRARRSTVQQKPTQSFEDEYDLRELTDQINEYQSTLEETMQSDHNEQNIPHYDQMIQMIGKLGWLSKLALTKGSEQDVKMKDLNDLIQEKETAMVNQQQDQGILEEELNQTRLQYDSIKLELQEEQRRYQETERLCQSHGETIEELKGVNQGLSTQISMHQNKEEDSKKDDSAAFLIVQKKDDQIAELIETIEKMKETETEQNKIIEEKRTNIKEQNKNMKAAYKEMKHSEIMQQKERYELLLKIKEFQDKVKQQKKDIQKKDTEIQVFKHKEVVAATTKQLRSQQSLESMIGSVTPELQNKGLLNSLVNSPEILQKQNSASGNVELNAKDVNVALEAVQEVQEEDNQIQLRNVDNRQENTQNVVLDQDPILGENEEQNNTVPINNELGGLDNDNELGGLENNELGGMDNNELGGLEDTLMGGGLGVEEQNEEGDIYQNDYYNDPQPNDMIGSGIADDIDPMGDAAYYQGSFTEQALDPHTVEIDTDFKSQGSDDQDQNELEQTPVLIEDADDFEDEQMLRQSPVKDQSDADQSTKASSLLKKPLTLDIDGDEYANSVAESPLATAFENPYLLHYKKQSEMLAKELLGPKQMPSTPSSRTEVEQENAKRDPEEEFFMLAVLSLKMLHNEEYDDAEYVYEISAAKLFKKVRQNGMPFHRWFKWLERQFQDLREAFVKTQDQEEENLDKWDLSEEKIKKKKKENGPKLKKSSTFFGKISKMMGKQKGKQVEMNSTSAARESIGSTPKKLDPSKFKFEESSEEKRYKTIKDTMQNRGEF